MKVLVLTYKRYLLEKLTALNPNLEYCAILVNYSDGVKAICDSVGLQTKVYSYHDSPSYLDLPCDYILVLIDDWWGTQDLKPLIEQQKVPINKVLMFYSLHADNNFLLERSLRYFKEHSAEFEIFATGISTAENALDVPSFNRKLFNFGRGSQDLYYNLQVAKFAISCGGGA